MKKYTQYGTLSIIIFIAILAPILIGLFYLNSYSPSEAIALKLVAIVLFVGLLTLYKLTIFISNNNLSFRFGVGWFGKTYQFSEIESCRPIKRSFMGGFGIHWLGSGWLYNVSGFKSIELQFKNSNSIVRIGTNRPEEICALIRKKLSNTIDS